MERKDILKKEILMKMRNHLDPSIYSMLDNVLTEKLYEVEINDKNNNLPATRDNTNEYILMLYEADKCVELSPYSLEAYFDTIKEFSRYIDKPLVNMTSEDINMYLLRKKKENNANSTLNNKRRNLNSFFNWMVTKKFIQFNPVEDTLKFKEVEKPVDYMTALEFDQLKNGCRNLRDRAMLEYLRCTASRKGEITNVKINQIDWSDGSILIYGEKSSAYRTVMVDSICKKYLMDYIIKERNLTLDSELPLFTHMRGDTTIALDRSGIYAAVKTIAKRAGITRRIYPHLFRKTTATNIVRRGGSESDAGFYLGHKPTGVTASHYIGRTEEHRKDIFKNHVETI